MSLPSVYGPDLGRQNDLVYDDELPDEEGLVLSPYHTRSWGQSKASIVLTAKAASQNYEHHTRVA
jgi:hypothetical protein